VKVQFELLNGMNGRRDELEVLKILEGWERVLVSDSA